MSSASASAPAVPSPRPARAGGRHRDLRRFLLRRLATGLVLCIGITLVAFALPHLVPGDPAAANLGQRAIGDPAAVAAFNRQYGLNRPLPVQYCPGCPSSASVPSRPPPSGARWWPRAR